MNFKKNYEMVKEKRMERRIMTLDHIHSTIKNYKITLATLLNNKGKAKLEIKNINGVDVFTREEIIKCATGSVTEMLQATNAECDVFYRTYITPGFTSMIIEFSVYPQGGGNIHARRYVYDYKEKMSKDISSKATKVAEKHEKTGQRTSI